MFVTENFLHKSGMFSYELHQETISAFYMHKNEDTDHQLSCMVTSQPIIVKIPTF